MEVCKDEKCVTVNVQNIINNFEVRKDPKLQEKLLEEKFGKVFGNSKQEGNYQINYGPFKYEFSVKGNLSSVVEKLTGKTDQTFTVKFEGEQIIESSFLKMAFHGKTSMNEIMSKFEKISEIRQMEEVFSILSPA